MRGLMIVVEEELMKRRGLELATNDLALSLLEVALQGNQEGIGGRGMRRVS